MASVCTGLPQKVSPVPWQQGHPRTAGPAHPGMDTWALGLCLLPARPKEVSLCKHEHNRRKPRPSFEVEPQSSDPTYIPLGSVKGSVS